MSRTPSPRLDVPVERQGPVSLLFDMQWQPGVSQTAIEQEPLVLIVRRAPGPVRRLDERRIDLACVIPEASLLVCGSMFTSSGTAPRRLLM